MQTKQEVIDWIEANRATFTRLSDQIWAHPETCHREFFASRIQAEALAGEGFRIAWEPDGLRTAFVAEWGQGRPVIGFLGEYDALEGLSQKNQSKKEPITPGAPGHGCGHNLLGVGCLASAVAVKRWLEATGTPGIVRYYGCPAEENTDGKTFMARAGVFNDLDAAFNYHPSHINATSKGSSVGVYDIRFRFHGKSAHAGGSPELGRSALDAVELMNVGVNYLREHVPSKVRIHYVITHGGDLPNVVPPEAEVWYFIRAHQREELDAVTHRVRKIAEGAALMTETSVEEVFRSACSAVLNNHFLADLQYANMQVVGPILFNEQELAYAQEINAQQDPQTLETMFKALELPEKYRGLPLIGDNFPADDEGQIRTGSTDVGDVSWIAPLSMLGTACFATGAPGHSWAIVATGAHSIGHKGMLHAAKIMALSAMDLYTDPECLKKARQEFEAATRDHPYTTPLPSHVKAPRYEPMG